jgi:alpha-tubulin suppressor-like RCC1 family protein
MAPIEIISPLTLLRNFGTLRLAFFVLLLVSSCAICIPAESAARPAEYEANAMVQWGHPRFMGVGPLSRSEYSIPPTPVGLYDDEVIIPVDGDYYTSSTDGYWTMVVVRKGGVNDWFVFGTIGASVLADPPILSSPLNVTSLFASTADLMFEKVLKLHIMSSVVLAAVLSSSSEIHIYSLQISADDYPFGLGRLTTTMLEQETPTLLNFGSFFTFPEGDESALLFECGAVYCVVSNTTVTYGWGTPVVDANSPIGSSVPILLISGGETILRIIPGPFFFMLELADHTFNGWGVTTVFSGDGSNAIWDGEAVVAMPQFPIPMKDIKCSLKHCLMLVNDSHIAPFGKNNNGQCGVSGHPIEVNLGDPLIYMDQLDLFEGNIHSVGAVGYVSFVLAENGLWAWGSNTLSGGSDYLVPSYTFGGRSLFASTLIPQKAELPEHFQPVLAPHMPMLRYSFLLATLSEWAVSLKCQVLETKFYELRDRRNGLSSLDAPVPRSAILSWGPTGSSTSVNDVGVEFAGSQVGNRTISSQTLYTPKPVIAELPSGRFNWTRRHLAVGSQHVIISAPKEDTIPDEVTMYAWGRFSGVGTTASWSNLPAGPSYLVYNAPLPVSIDPLIEFEALGMSASKTATCGFTYNNGATTTTFHCWGPVLHIGWPIENMFDCSTPQLKCSTGHCVFIPHLGDSVSAYLYSWLTVENDGVYPEESIGRVGSQPFEPISMLTAVSDAGLTSIHHMSLGHGFTIISNLTHVFGCGISDKGQVGVFVEAPFPEFRPIQLGPITAIKEITSGKDHSLLLTSNDIIYSWGSNEFGQLGEKLQQTLISSPVLFSAPQYWKTIACVVDTSFAVSTQGFLFAWGRNGFANSFGNAQVFGNLITKLSPVQVDIGAALGITSKIEWIHSSAFVNTIFANAILTPSIPLPIPQQPSVKRKLILFGHDMGFTPKLSSWEAGWSSQGKTVPVTFALNELVTCASSYADVLWLGTSHGNVYVSAILTSDLPVTIRNESNPLYGLTSAPTPVLFQSFGQPIVSITTNKYLTIVILQEGEAYVIYSEAANVDHNTALVQLLVGQAAYAHCSAIGCGILTKTKTLRLMASDSAPPIFEVVSFVNVNHFGSSAAIITMTPGIGSMVYTNDSGIYLLNQATKMSYSILGSFPIITVSVLRLSVGHAHFLILGSDANIYGGGSYHDGQLPNLATLLNGAQPLFVPFFAALTPIDVFAMASTSFVICQNGDVYVWGMFIMQKPTSFGFDTPNVLINHFLDATTFLEPKRVPLPNDDRIMGIVGDPASILGYPPVYRYFAWTGAGPLGPSPPFTPVNPSTETAECSSSPPSSTVGWKCNAATWVFTGNLQVTPSSPIEITGPVVIEGDLDIPPGTTVIVQIGEDLLGDIQLGKSFGPFLNVTGCATIQEALEIDLDKNALKKLKSGTRVTLLESACSQTGTNLLVTAGPNAKKGCRQYSAKAEQQQISQRHTVVAILTVTKDNCNWWIILVSVIGGLILLASIFLIVVFTTPLKNVIMPYNKARMDSARRASGK